MLRSWRLRPERGRGSRSTPLAVHIQSELVGDFSRHVGTRAAKLAPQTLLRCRPQHVSVAIAKANRRIGLMFALFRVPSFDISEAYSGRTASRRASFAGSDTEALPRVQ